MSSKGVKFWLLPWSRWINWKEWGWAWWTGPVTFFCCSWLLGEWRGTAILHLCGPQFHEFQVKWFSSRRLSLNHWVGFWFDGFTMEPGISASLHHCISAVLLGDASLREAETFLLIENIHLGFNSSICICQQVEPEAYDTDFAQEN